MVGKCSKGEKTLAELAQLFDVHPNQITTWRSQLLDGAAAFFGGDSAADSAEQAVDVKTLQAKISELTLANDFLAGALGKAGSRGRFEGHAAHGRAASGTPVRGQPDAARPVAAGRHRDRSPACRDADETNGDRGDLSAPEHVKAGAQGNGGHKIYPYLLRKLPIVRPNQVWASDISYMPMAKGFVYLVAIVDRFSRKVLAHRLSITMEADFCVKALEEALARYGKPEIFNTDQGSQFTAQAFTSVPIRERIAISIDGRGAWRDNVIVERLGRSVKYGEVYLRAYGAGSEARGSIGRYLNFDNNRRPHSSLAAKTPDQTYFDNLPLMVAA